MSGMKRAALFIFLSALSILNLYCAFSPEFARYFPLPIKNQSVRRLVYKFAGIIFLVCALLLLYGAFMPTVPEE